MITDTKPKPKAQPSFATPLQATLDDYATLPPQEKHRVDLAITQHLDLTPKDWVMAMNALTTALKR